MTKKLFVFLTMFLLSASLGTADIVQFDLAGNAGAGLLPGNENAPVVSDAFGSETGVGIVFDTDTNTLSLEFEFEGLSGGLFDAGGGIHIHDAGPDAPFDSNGSVEFFLNTGGVNVPIGSTFGSIDVDVVLTEAQEDELFNDQYYINIHSGDFNSGELRGNLVQAIPEPSLFGMISLLTFSVAAKRRRQN